MIIDCPACGAGLWFDPETGKMKCEACGNLFEPYELADEFQTRGEKELNSSEQNMNKNPRPYFNPYSDFDHPVYDHTDVSENTDYNDSEEMMECSIYTCTSCGAEIAVNDNETSTFCSFCGQPTVVFSRIASRKKPEYIIPFSVSKEKAISLIRERLNEGFYVPDSIKNFEIERVRGIYIPFWLYDVYYHDRQYLKGKVDHGKHSHTYYYYRNADCEFSMIPLDASQQLHDEISQRLEPYDIDGIRDFSFEYLSGFYADCYDMKPSQLDDLAISRAKEMFDGAVKCTINAHSISRIKNDPEYRINGTHYAMFPAWFLTLRYEDIPYTLTVNGQTGKIVGGIPYDRSKFIANFGKFTAVLIIIITIGTFVCLLKDLIGLVYLVIFTSVLLLPGGLSSIKEFKHSTMLSGLSDTTRFVKDRGKQ